MILHPAVVIEDHCLAVRGIAGSPDKSWLAGVPRAGEICPDRTLKVVLQAGHLHHIVAHGEPVEPWTSPTHVGQRLRLLLGVILLQTGNDGRCLFIAMRPSVPLFLGRPTYGCPLQLSGPLDW